MKRLKVIPGKREGSEAGRVKNEKKGT